MRKNRKPWQTTKDGYSARGNAWFFLPGPEKHRNGTEAGVTEICTARTRVSMATKKSLKEKAWYSNNPWLECVWKKDTSSVLLTEILHNASRMIGWFRYLNQTPPTHKLFVVNLPKLIIISGKLVRSHLNSTITEQCAELVVREQIGYLCGVMDRQYLTDCNKCDCAWNWKLSCSHLIIKHQARRILQFYY